MSTEAQPSAELAEVAPVTDITRRMRANYDPGQVELLRKTVAKDCNNEEFGMFLELAARYQLDPFAKQIWAAKIGGRVTVFAGRDGMLKIARDTGRFEGIPGDVVREHDLFEKWMSMDGAPKVKHRYRDADGKPTADAEKRGKILGAWAIAKRTDEEPMFFFAQAGQYMPRSPDSHSPWSKQPDVMMLKCAQSTALRLAFSISGLVGDEEFAAMRHQNLTAPSNGGLDYGPDLQVAARIEQLFDLLGYKDRKRVLKLAGPVGTGLDDGGRLQLITELVAEAQRSGLEVPPLEEVVEGTVVEEPEADAAA